MATAASARVSRAIGVLHIRQCTHWYMHTLGAVSFAVCPHALALMLGALVDCSALADTRGTAETKAASYKAAL